MAEYMRVKYIATALDFPFLVALGRVESGVTLGELYDLQRQVDNAIRAYKKETGE